MSSWTKGKAAAYLVAVFLMGATAGGALGFGVAHRPSFRPPPPPQSTASFLVEMLRREVGLTDDQVRSVEPIATNAAAQMEALRCATSDKFEALVKETDQRIETLLTPAQLESFRAFQKRQAEHRAKHHGPGPGDRLGGHEPSGPRGGPRDPGLGGPPR